MQAGTSMNKKFIAAHTVDLDPVLRHYHLCTVDYWGSMSYLVSQSGDKVSQLHVGGIGKATSWKTSTMNDYLLDGLGRDTLSDKTLTNDERFICWLYSNNETYTNINDVRFKMFEKDTKEPEKLPLTQSSLRLHIKRTHYQCTIWLASFIAQLDIGSPVGND